MTHWMPFLVICGTWLALRLINLDLLIRSAEFGIWQVGINKQYIVFSLLTVE